MHSVAYYNSNFLSFFFSTFLIIHFLSVLNFLDDQMFCFNFTAHFCCNGQIERFNSSIVKKAYNPHELAHLMVIHTLTLEHLTISANSYIHIMH